MEKHMSAVARKDQSVFRERSEVTSLLTKALSRIIEEEPELLDLDVTERALSHHLARIISELLPSNSLDVDVEYNRHGGDPKRLQLPERETSDRDLRARTVFPDIVVHRRNTDEENLLVVEVKKPGESLKYDGIKLRAFRRELGYQYAVHLILGYDGEGNLVQELQWVDGADSEKESRQEV